MEVCSCALSLSGASLILHCLYEYMFRYKGISNREDEKVGKYRVWIVASSTNPTWDFDILFFYSRDFGGT